MVRHLRTKECVVFLGGGWDGLGGEIRRQGCVVQREIDVAGMCFGGEGGHAFGVCFIRKRSLVLRVQRKHKGFLRVEHSAKP